MEIADWRRQIDEIDRKLVELLNQRAEAAHHIGKLKSAAGAPVYEPNRERLVIENVHAANHGPLPNGHLQRIYERIMDVMRRIQIDEMAPGSLSADDRSPAEIDHSRLDEPETH